MPQGLDLELGIRVHAVEEEKSKSLLLGRTFAMGCKWMKQLGDAQTSIHRRLERAMLKAVRTRAGQYGAQRVLPPLACRDGTSYRSRYTHVSM